MQQRTIPTCLTLPKNFYKVIICVVNMSLTSRIDINASRSGLSLNAGRKGTFVLMMVYLRWLTTVFWSERRP